MCCYNLGGPKTQSYVTVSRKPQQHLRQWVVIAVGAAAMAAVTRSHLQMRQVGQFAIGWLFVGLAE